MLPLQGNPQGCCIPSKYLHFFCLANLSPLLISQIRFLIDEISCCFMIAFWEENNVDIISFNPFILHDYACCIFVEFYCDLLHLIIPNCLIEVFPLFSCARQWHTSIRKLGIMPIAFICKAHFIAKQWAQHVISR